MTSILVTGSKGQLGSELQELAPGYPEYRFVFTDVDELNITDPVKINAFFASDTFDVVVNCAAYTAVDKAEEDEENALLLNGKAAGYLAEACAGQGGFFIQVSTDYLFGNHAERPITEEDIPAPTSVYGRTKLAGESEVLRKAVNGVIIRTSWLYSSYGHNFVKTILKFGRERGMLNVVNDQHGTPTYARDLAMAILEVINKRENIKGVEIFNYSNEGETTWYDFAVELLAMKGVKCTVNPVSTAGYPAKAARPAYSVLSKEKIRNALGLSIPDWKISLKECLNKLD